MQISLMFKVVMQILCTDQQQSAWLESTSYIDNEQLTFFAHKI